MELVQTGWEAAPPVFPRAIHHELPDVRGFEGRRSLRGCAFRDGASEREVTRGERDRVDDANGTEFSLDRNYWARMARYENSPEIRVVLGGQV